MNITFKAIQSLLPKKSWKLKDEPTSQQEFVEMFEIVTGKTADNDAIYSTNPSDFGVTWSEIQNEIIRLQNEEIVNAYIAKRAVEYPPITDYIDGVVKGDQAQIQAYIDACLEVKAKYPKGAA